MLERGRGFRAGLAGIRHYLNIHTLSDGMVAGVINIGPLLLLAELARQGGLEEREVAAWVAAVFTLGACLTFTLGLYYQKPINAAWTIAGAVVVGGALQQYTPGQLAGASLVAGILVAGAGFWGLVSSLVKLLPLPLVMGMIGGTLLRFALQVPQALVAAPLLTGMPLLGYLILVRFYPRLPGVLGALVLGLTVAALQGRLAGAVVPLALAQPVLIRPELHLGAITTVGLPLALMIVGVENMQAIGILISEGYQEKDGGIPVNAMMFLSGLATVLAALGGGHAANIAGVKTAICATGKNVAPEGRYVSSLVEGVIFLSIGLFAPIVLGLVGLFPTPLLQFITGLAMLPVIGNALRIAFSGGFPLGGTFAFLTAAAGVTVFGIGAPLWSLVGGIMVIALTGEGCGGICTGINK